MGDVTALMMDVVTEKSGHVMTGMAVSVCLTPAAPAPLPIPYPLVGQAGEGIMDPCLRTKICGSPILTVGGNLTKCHGNEPGTLKEVVSLNTTGPCPPLVGAPIVFIELGMAGITGSIGPMNKQPIPGAGGSVSGAGGGGGDDGGAGGGGGGPGGSGPQGPSNGGGGGGGNQSGAAPPSPPGPPSADGQANAGHPIDVVTGTMFTSPVADLRLPGFLPFELGRSYATSDVRHDGGIGWGWSHDLDWHATKVGGQLVLHKPGGRTAVLPIPDPDTVMLLPFRAKVGAKGDGFWVELGDRVFRHLRPVGGGRYRLAELRDEWGSSVEVQWDASGVTLVDSVGRRARRSRVGDVITWDVTVTDAEGKDHARRMVSYELDARGDLVRVVDAGGAETRFEYDERHYLLAEHQPDGLVYRFRYDDVRGVRRCVETWGELPGQDVLSLLGVTASPAQPIRGVHHARLSYEPESRRTRVMDAAGATHVYVGNALGQVEVYTDPRGYAHTLRYDPLGNLVSHRDGGGRLRRRSFDASGRLSGETSGDGESYRLHVDEDAQRSTLRLPDGSEEHFTLSKGIPVARTNAAGTTLLAYDERGRVTSITRPNGAVVRREYDAHGNLKAELLPTGAATRYEFDLFGCPTQITTAAGRELKLHYDSRFDLVLLEDSAGGRTEWQLDASRKIVAKRDESGLTTIKRVAGVPVETVLADGRTYRMRYDSLLRLVSLENPAGERHDLDLDLAGNLVREKTFADLTTQFELDGSGLLSALHRADGSSARFERDGEGRLLSVERSDGTGEKYAYDSMGRLTAARNAHSVVSFAYDPLGNVTEDVLEAGGHRFTVTREHDSLGRVTHKRFSGDWEIRLDRRPEDGAVLSIDGAGPRVLVERDPSGAELARSEEGGRRVEFERTRSGLVSRASVRFADAPLRTRSWTYSPKGPVQTVDDDRWGGRSYELDDEGRPVGVRGLGAAERFHFAPQGTPVPEGDEGFAVGKAGRPLRAAQSELAWDARGRLVGRRSSDPRETWDYTWDDGDRLLGAKRGDGFAVRYLYDALGRRVGEQRGDGTSTWYGWDGDTVVEEKRSTGETVRRLFADDGFTPLSEQRGGVWRWVLTDSAATPWLYLDPSGEVGDVDLTAWGRVARSSGETGDLRFAGQTADPLTGLHYNRHRYYDPKAQVFTTPDPLGLVATLHDIGFVGNVTFFVDPLGLTTIVVLEQSDGVVSRSAARLQQQYPGAQVVNYNQLTPGQLASESHVVLIGHAAPGIARVEGGALVNGQSLGSGLSAAGFRGSTPGARVDAVMCNGATPGAGGRAGTGTSVAQGIANTTGAPTSGGQAAHPGTAGSGNMSVGAAGQPGVRDGSIVTATPAAPPAAPPATPPPATPPPATPPPATPPPAGGGTPSGGGT